VAGSEAAARTTREEKQVKVSPLIIAGLASVRLRWVEKMKLAFRDFAPLLDQHPHFHVSRLQSVHGVLPLLNGRSRVVVM
jgi:hypothetical protein